MKITYLKLKNYTGIYNGMGLNEIEIDFTKSKNNIIMLVGANGSGKSCILSTLHPFASTLDDRNEYILDKLDGEKEIRYSYMGEDYKINHYYNAGKTNRVIKSYIYILDNDGEWIDLNPNGNVTSFKEIVQERLKVVESFFKLSRIGSNVTNFIDMKTSERKKYIGNFLPNIEPYLKAYDNVNAKALLAKKSIAVLTSQINKIGKEEELLERNSQILKDIDIYKKELDVCTKRLWSKEEFLNKEKPLDELLSNLKDNINEENELNQKLEDDAEVEEFLVNKFSVFQECKDNIPLIEEKIKNAEIKKGMLEKEKCNITNSIQPNLEKKAKVEKELITLNKSIKEIQNGTTKDEIDIIINNYEERIKEINKILSKTKFKNCSSEDINNIVAVTDLLENYKNSLNNYSDVYGIATDNNIIISEEIIKSNNIIVKFKKDIYNAEINNQRIKDNKELVKLLEHEDGQCESNCACYKYVSSIKDLSISTKILEELKLKLKEEEENNILLKKAKTCKEYIEITEELITNNPKFQSIKNIPLIANILNTDCININIKSLLSIIDDISEIICFETELKQIEYSKKDYINKRSLIESQNSLLKLYNEKIENLNEEKIIIEEELSQIQPKEENLEKQIKSLDSYINTFNRFLDIRKNVKERSQRLADLTCDNFELDEKVRTVKIYTREIKEDKLGIRKVEEHLEVLNEELDDNKFNIKRLEEFQKELKGLNIEFELLNELKEVLSPTKGIPVKFTSNYLKPTKRIANELLDESNNGNFQIDNFKIDKKDFFISVKKENGKIVKDISIASQGENALVSIALSLALIEQSMSKYNILCLDEIDATLDSSNRNGFIAMLESQLEKLDIEQTFIISHNNNFDAYPVDLILCKGNDIDSKSDAFLNNKNILFKF